MFLHNANDAKTFLKHFSDCLFYFCSTCADSITGYWPPPAVTSVEFLRYVYILLSSHSHCTVRVRYDILGYDNVLTSVIETEPNLKNPFRTSLINNMLIF